MNLYDINDEFKKALDNVVDIEHYLLADSSTGEVFTKEEYEKVLNDIKLKKDEKIKNILFYIKNLENDEDILSKEIKRLQELKKSKNNHKERLKEYLLDNVDKGEKYDFTTIKLSCVAGLESIKIEPDAKIPTEYLKVEYTPIKADLKKALKSGIEIEGVYIEKKEKRLIIK